MVKVNCVSCGRRCKGSVLRVEMHFVHKECFKCAVCHGNLERGGFYRREKQFYCRQDYLNAFGTRCAVCMDIVEGEVLNMLGKTFHSACLNCDHCRCQFQSGDKATYWNGVYLCSSCSSEKRQSKSKPPPSKANGASPTPPMNGTPSGTKVAPPHSRRTHLTGASPKGHVTIQEAPLREEDASDDDTRGDSRQNSIQIEKGRSNGDSFFSSSQLTALHLTSDSEGLSGAESGIDTPRRNVDATSSHWNDNEASGLSEAASVPSPVPPTSMQRNPVNGAPTQWRRSLPHHPPPVYPPMTQQQAGGGGGHPVRKRNRNNPHANRPLSAGVYEESGHLWRQQQGPTTSETAMLNSFPPFSYLHRQLQEELQGDIPPKDRYHRSPSGYSTPLPWSPVAPCGCSVVQDPLNNSVITHASSAMSGYRSPPHFHRPPGVHFSYRNGPSYKGEWRRGVPGLLAATFSPHHRNVGGEVSGISVARDAHDEEDEEATESARRLACYPDARPPSDNRPPPIERPDWPGPPSSAVLLIEKIRQKSSSLPTGGQSVSVEEEASASAAQTVDAASESNPQAVTETAATHRRRPLETRNSVQPGVKTNIGPLSSGQHAYILHRTAVPQHKFVSPSCPTTPRLPFHQPQIVNRVPLTYILGHYRTPTASSETGPGQTESHQTGSMETSPSSSSTENHAQEVSPSSPEDTDTLKGLQGTGRGSLAGLRPLPYCLPSVQDWLKPTEGGLTLHLPYSHCKPPAANPKIYPYELLKNPSKRPKGLDLTRLESYLSEEEFSSLFPLNRTEFSLLPAWKQNDFKRRAGLF